MFKRKKSSEKGQDEAAPASSAGEPAAAAEPGAEPAPEVEGPAPHQEPVAVGDGTATDGQPEPLPEGAAAATASPTEGDGHGPAPNADPAPVAVSPPPPPPEYQEEGRLPVSFYVGGLFDPPRPPSRDALERQAEEEFRAAISPSLQPLRQLVPDASSPDEAMRVLAERQGELLPDPEGERERGSDIYRTDASVYYRIRRHFDQPSRRVGLARRAPWRPPPGLARPRD